MTARQEAGTATPSDALSELYETHCNELDAAKDRPVSFDTLKDLFRRQYNELGKLANTLSQALTAAREALEAKERERWTVEQNTLGVLIAWRRDYDGEKERGDKWMADCKAAEQRAATAEAAQQALSDAINAMWPEGYPYPAEGVDALVRRCKNIANERTIAATNFSVTNTAYVNADEGKRAAEAALAGVREDAERYCWLRDKSEPNNPECTFYLSIGEAFKDMKFKRHTVDAAIDAARLPPSSGSPAEGA